MTNLNERKLQLEALISSLQNELELVNQQLENEVVKESPSLISTNENGTTCIVDGDFVTLKNGDIELGYFFNSLYTKSKKYVKRGAGKIGDKQLSEAISKNQWKADRRKRLSTSEFEAIVKLENELHTFGFEF